MDREEAVEVLKDMLDYQWGFADFEKPKSIEAIQMGIESLKNQKTLQEELEKLKVEFEEDKYILLNQITAIKIIDNKISELKGENKNDM